MHIVCREGLVGDSRFPGGWTGSTYFSQAMSSANQATFVQACVDAVNTYDLDGLFTTALLCYHGLTKSVDRNRYRLGTLPHGYTPSSAPIAHLTLVGIP